MKTAYDIFTLKEKIYGKTYGKILRIINGLAYQFCNFVWIYKQICNNIPDGVYAVDGLKLGFEFIEDINYFDEPELTGEPKGFWINTAILKSFSKFTSTDTYRPSMNNVVITGNKIAATDAHKLIFQDFEFSEYLLIPPSVIKLLPKNELVYFELYERHIKVNIRDYYIIYHIASEKFPDFNSIIPTEFTNTLKFDASKIELNKHSFINKEIIISQEDNVLRIISSNQYSNRQYIQEFENNNIDNFKFKVSIEQFKICVEGLKEAEFKTYKHLLLINENIILVTLEID